jgi:hypothetical protein
MAATPTPRTPTPRTRRAPRTQVLRIGVVQAGKIVEERLIAPQQRVTVGASPRNTLVVPGLPRSVTLFELRRGRYHLRLGAATDARVSLGQQVLALDQLRARAVPLDDSARGRVVLGEVTILFQLVAPPPQRPRPQLPPSVRGRLWANVDWTLAASFVAVLAIHLGMVSYLRGLEPRAVDVDLVPAGVVEYEPPTPPVVLDPATLRQIGDAPLPRAAPARPGGVTRRARPARPCDRACLERQVSQMGLVRHLRLLGARGGGSRTVANLIGPGAPDTEADRAFAGVRGLTVSSRATAGLQGKGHDDGPVGPATIDDLGPRVDGPDAVGTGGTVVERVPRAVVRHHRPVVEDDTINADAVGRVVRRGMPAVRTCYQRALKRNPRLAGKIDLRLDVNTMGKVTPAIDADSTGDPGLCACIRGYAARWRFPPPARGSAAVTVPLVFEAAEER